MFKEKNLFKLSYSKFLRTKKQTVECLNSSHDAADVEFFKRSIYLHYQHEYATKKWQNNFYRILFFSFGCLFSLFSLIIFLKTTNAACGLFFSDCSIAKNCLNTVCLLLAGGAFIYSYAIHPEKEAIQHLVGKVNKELNHPAKHLQIEFQTIFSNFSHQKFSLFKNIHSYK